MVSNYPTYRQKWILHLKHGNRHGTWKKKALNSYHASSIISRHVAKETLHLSIQMVHVSLAANTRFLHPGTVSRYVHCRLQPLHVREQSENALCTEQRRNLKAYESYLFFYLKKIDLTKRRLDGCIGNLAVYEIFTSFTEGRQGFCRSCHDPLFPSNVKPLTTKFII